MLNAKKVALCVAITLLIVANITYIAFANDVELVEEVPIWEQILESFAPLISTTGVSIIIAFFYAFLGKWGNHTAWTWEKFRPTLITAILNGIIFTGLGVATGWSFADIELWVSQFSGLYVMQKLIKVVAPYLKPLLGITT